MGIGDTNSRCLVVLVVIFFPVFYTNFFLEQDQDWQLCV